MWEPSRSVVEPPTPRLARTIRRPAQPAPNRPRPSFSFSSSKDEGRARGRGGKSSRKSAIPQPYTMDLRGKCRHPRICTNDVRASAAKVWRLCTAFRLPTPQSCSHHPVVPALIPKRQGTAAVQDLAEFGRVSCLAKRRGVRALLRRFGPTPTLTATAHG